MKPINSDQQYFSYCDELEQLINTGLATQEAKNKYHELVTHIHNWDDTHREPDYHPKKHLLAKMELNAQTN